MKVVFEVPADDLAALEARVTASVLAKIDARLAVLATPEPRPSKLFMRVAEFAAYRAISKRTVVDLLARGLPSVGKGRLRRIPVSEADAWLATRTSTT